MPTTPRQPAGPLELLWRALNSLPVAIFVMLALALLSALGTLIPQEHLNPQPPAMTFADFMALQYGPGKAALLHRLAFDHIYFSWYFNTLLVWLAVSAVICNIVRWRTTWRLWQRPVVRRGARFFLADRRSWLFTSGGMPDGGTGVTARVPADRQINAPALATAETEEVAAAIAVDLRLLGYRTRTESDGTATTLYADRGFAKKWALVLLHIAILILLAGGFYGAAVGVKGNIRIADNSTKTLTVDIAQGKYQWVQPWLKRLPELTWELHQHHFRIDWGRKLVLETDIEKNVPPDLQEFYRYYVDNYVSDLEVTHNGQTLRREVRVNHPLISEKLVVYQSGYEQRGYLTLRDESNPAAAAQELPMPSPVFGADTWYALTRDGVAVQDPKDRSWFTTEDLSDEDIIKHPVPESEVSGISFRVTDNVKSGDLYKHQVKVGRIGPMLLVTLRDNGSGQELGSLIMTDKVGFDTRIGGVPFAVRMSTKVDDYSVFAYKRDPGSPVLFIGWLLLVIGIALTMYVPFTQLWLRAEPGSLSVLALGPDAGRNGRLKRRLDVMLGADSAG